MFRQFLLFFFLFALAISTGCSTKSQFNQVSDAQNQCPPYFSIGEIKDSSNYSPGKNDPAIEPSEMMRSALKNELTKKGYFAEKSENVSTINIEILNYAPGNAFARWLFPGAGASKLKIQTALVDCKNIEIANIPIDRSIAAGGGYTIGAWEYVFTDVAERLVQDLEKNVLKK
ncbi:DUF4410 domain-containing protein [Desulfomicrobium sp. ZS1]|uniref:DUF4410 domain-containing protein n=1 Tax=Desulfomicrobium sp. ZS1 TaxID=2952228 RepID=UPI0020B1F6BC|nr:DUF4410 domain-containing protein [Desulfomicrobium sp. ZS1]UTF51796.1 DUF4410 domain-containing protein [Desulfomicrobium sp. ZS1]